MKVFDYMATGRPIIATDHQTVREVLQHKHNAFLVPPQSGRELALGIQWLIDHPTFASKLGKQARQDCEHYTWPNRIRRISRWLKEQLGV